MMAIDALPWRQWPGRAVVPDSHLVWTDRVALGERAAAVPQLAVGLRAGHLGRNRAWLRSCRYSSAISARSPALLSITLQA